MIILVGRSYKRNPVVVMFREDYTEEVKNLLSDSTTYKMLNTGPTKKTQDNINNFLKTLRDDQMITDKPYK